MICQFSVLHFHHASDEEMSKQHIKPQDKLSTGRGFSSITVHSHTSVQEHRGRSKGCTGEILESKNKGSCFCTHKSFLILFCAPSIWFTKEIHLVHKVLEALRSSDGLRVASTCRLGRQFSEQDLGSSQKSTPVTERTICAAKIK